MIPGVSGEDNDVVAMGISRGYVCKSHTDGSKDDFSETIVWKDGMPFSIVRYSLLFAGGSYKMLMVLGSVEHGTPDAKINESKPAYGAAIICKGELLKHAEQIKFINSRGTKYSYNPFMPNYSYDDAQTMCCVRGCATRTDDVSFRCSACLEGYCKNCCKSAENDVCSARVSNIKTLSKRKCTLGAN
jgi:hypothetical protein